MWAVTLTAMSIKIPRFELTDRALRKLCLPRKTARRSERSFRRFEGPGIFQGIHNTDASITSFAKACFAYALDQKIDVWFATKDTISKTYDTRFKEIFEQEYEQNWKDPFQSHGIEYFYTLIDDAVARIMKSEGGMLWACKNYDGDVMSDMLASAYGSLALMTSVLVSPGGCFMYEAAHGTVQRHYYQYQAGEKTSTNPMALIFCLVVCAEKAGRAGRGRRRSAVSARLWRRLPGKPSRRES